VRLFIPKEDVILLKSKFMKMFEIIYLFKNCLTLHPLPTKRARFYITLSKKERKILREEKSWVC